jgi:hypothetical protein
MKKRYFKKWIDILLIHITLIAFIIIVSVEHDSILIDLIIKITCIIILYVNSFLLSKYSRILKEK